MARPVTREPKSGGTMAGLVGAISRAHAPVALDDVDRQLIQRLAADPRVSQRQLAREVNMSAPAVGDRISRLERLGVIRGYTIDVDWSALGYPLLVYIPMIIAPGADLSQILARLRGITALDELIVVTGTYDLIARFRFRDHAHLQEVLLDELWPIDGLQRIETFLSLGEVQRPPIVEKLMAAHDEDQ